MGRPPIHGITRPHPSPRFRDTIRLHQFRRGPTDDLWSATFHLRGAWQTRKPVSLGTRDYDEACEVARDKYAIATTGQPVTRAYNTPQPGKPAVDHPLRLYAEKAIATLKQQEIAANASVTGKGHTFGDLIRRIEHVWIPRWGDTDITRLTDHGLNDWVSDEYRVIDKAATATLPKTPSREVLYKTPAKTTLGNLDRALLFIWNEAVGDKIVDRRQRPMINRGKGEDTEPRAFIDAIGVQGVAKVMTPAWIAIKYKRERPGIRRMLHAYVALLACTGIRAGLEAERVQLGNVHFLVQKDKPVILIDIVKRQGKHREPRVVVVYEGEVAFDIRTILADHIRWRQSLGATMQDHLFAWQDGSRPDFDSVLRRALQQANALTDPMTGEKRVAYSFRHYFATRLIELNLSVPQIAEWLGTSSAMIEKHYSKYLIARNAHLVNGGNLRWHHTLREMPHPIDPWESDRDVELQIKGN